MSSMVRPVAVPCRPLSSALVTAVRASTGGSSTRPTMSLTIAVSGSLNVDDLDLVVQAALDGAGLAWVAEDRITQYLDSGALVRACSRIGVRRSRDSFSTLPVGSNSHRPRGGDRRVPLAELMRAARRRATSRGPAASARARRSVERCPATTAWVLCAPTWHQGGPAWPEYAFFSGLSGQRSRRFSAAPAIPREPSTAC